MKKLILIASVLMAVLLCTVSMFVLPIAAEDGGIVNFAVPGDDTWSFDEATGTLTISYSGAMPDFTSTAPWYAYRDAITTVVIEKGVTSIGNNAFRFCGNLKEVTFGTNSRLAYIGANAFDGCSSLVSIGLTANMPITYIGSYAFADCSSLKSVVIPGTVTAIAEYTFYDCTALESVNFASPSQIKSIGAHAFHNCKKLAEIAIPNGVTAIGEFAFRDCSVLKAVVIPTSVQQIGNGAFYGCSSLISAYYNGASESFGAVFCGVYNEVLANNLKYAGSEHEHVYAWWVNEDDEEYHYAECACGTAEKRMENHQWDEGEVTLAPTHMTEGEKLFTCKHCGAQYTQAIDRDPTHSYVFFEQYDETRHKALCECSAFELVDHNWDAGVVTKVPTHTVSGIRLHTCADCGQTREDTLDKLAGHTDGKWVAVDENTHKRVCVCGAELETGVAHKWNDGVVTAPATHTTPGYVTYTCKDCGQTKTVAELDKLEAHEFGHWTYFNENEHKRVCACGAEETLAHSYTDWMPHTADMHKKVCDCGYVTAAHVWDAGVVTKNPTHLESGVLTFTCACTATKTTVLPAIADHTFGDWESVDGEFHEKKCECGAGDQKEPHEWSEGVVTLQPTHMTTGVKTFTCLICSGEKYEIVEKLLDDHTYNIWFPYNADQHQLGCACNAKQEEFAAHNWNNGVVTRQPTHLTEGVKLFTCADCGATRTEAVAKTTTHTYNKWVKYDADQHQAVCACGQTTAKFAAHNWNEGEVLTQPTHTTEGQRKLTCLDCGQETTVAIPVLADHTYGGWTTHDDAQHKKTCACGDVVYADHAWDEGVVTKEATKKEEGEKLLTCLDCGATSTEAIAKVKGLGIVWIIVIVVVVLAGAAVAVVLIIRRRRANALAATVSRTMSPFFALSSVTKTRGFRK